MTPAASTMARRRPPFRSDFPVQFLYEPSPVTVLDAALGQDAGTVSVRTHLIPRRASAKFELFLLPRGLPKRAIGLAVGHRVPRKRPKSGARYTTRRSLGFCGPGGAQPAAGGQPRSRAPSRLWFLRPRMAHGIMSFDGFGRPWTVLRRAHKLSIFLASWGERAASCRHRRPSVSCSVLSPLLRV